MTKADRTYSGLEIAVIGMAARVPGADDIDQYWRNIVEGAESITRFSDSELIAFGRSEEEIRSPYFVPAHGVINDSDRFDAEFFGYSAREAALIDPQQRVFLETAYHALEAAGYARAPDALTGVFAGASASTYLARHALMAGATNPAAAFQANYSNHVDFLATRIAYKLGLTGPALTVQTACSTSLVAIQLACQSLLGGACDMAIAGGVSISLPNERGYLRQDGMIFSPDGHCRPFDADAGGTLKGDGAGCVVLKRLEDALADGDRIDAVILGGAINNDGAQKAGYTAPGYDGQTEVIRAAHAAADIDPETIGYIEAHGTATPLGDPLEISALSRAFAAATEKRNFAAIGSAKASIGHLDAAAGVAGFIKAALVVGNGVIPPAVNFHAPNPDIGFEASPVFVPTQHMEWAPATAPRRAAVSSFGIGGTNAHLILEQPPEYAEIAPSPARNSASDVVLTISAQTEQSCSAYSERVSDIVRESEESELGVIAANLGRRPAYKKRFAAIGSTKAEALAALKNDASPDQSRGEVSSDGAPALVFLCTGQGAQHSRMAGGGDAAFSETIDRALTFAARAGAPNLRKALFPSDGAKAPDLKQTALAQPALVAVEIAAATALASMGAQPTVIIGHSIGELAAAHIAGALALKDAMELAVIRGRLMQEAPPGVMMAVSLSEREAERFCRDRVSVAAVNGPKQTVLSGPAEAVATVKSAIENELGAACKLLETSHAFHSSMMDAAAGAFMREAAQRQFSSPSIRMISSVTGRELSGAELSDPEYWRRNLREPVRFADAIAQATAQRSSFLMELGPGDALVKLARQSGAKIAGGASALPGRRGSASVARQTKRAAAEAWCAGLEINLNPDLADTPRLRLPAYEFDRQRFWIERSERPSSRATQSANDAPGVYAPVWRSVPRRPAGTSAKGERWLIVAQDDETAAAFAGAAVGLGVNPYKAVSGKTLAIQAARAALDLTRGDQMDELIAHLMAGNTGLRRILFVADSEDTAAPPRSSTFLAAATLVRSLSRAKEAQPVELVAVLGGGFNVSGAEMIDGGRRSVLALMKAVAQETSGVSFSAVDTPLNCARGAADDIIRMIADEGRPEVIALRGGRSWSPEFAPTELADEKKASSAFPDGVYLFAGAGAIATALAERILENPKARLAILSRRGQPDDASGSELAKLVENAADRAIWLKGDITRPRDLTDTKTMISEKWGETDYLFHLAGVVGADAVCPCADMSDDEISRQMAAKIDGALTIAEIFADTPGLRVVLFSSLAATLGGVGAGLYAAANAWLDAFAEQRASAGDARWISLQFDPWALAAGHGLATEAACNATRDALSSREPVLAISAGGLEQRISGRESQQARQPAVQSPENAPAPGAASDSSDLSDAEKNLLLAFCEVFGRSDIGIDDNFFEIGGDSVMSIQIVSRAKQCGLVLTPDQIFESQTIRALSRAAKKAAPDDAPARTAAHDRSTYELSGLDDDTLARIAQTLDKDAQRNS